LLNNDDLKTESYVSMVSDKEYNDKFGLPRRGTQITKKDD